MSLLLGQNQGIMQFGNRSDVCELTARDISATEKKDLMAVKRDLRGKLEGQKVVKIRHSGVDFVISLEMIHKIADQFPIEKKEEIVDGEE